MRFNPYRKSPTGFWTPDYIAFATDLKPGEKRAYSVLCRYAGKDGDCFPSEQTIAKDLMVCERQARRYVAALVKSGYIEVDRGHRHKSNRYFFAYKEEFAKFGIQPEMSSQTGRECPLPVRTPESHQEIQKQEIQVTEPQTTDLDLQPANRKNHDSQAAFAPGVRETMTRELGYDPGLHWVNEVMFKAGNDERIALHAIEQGLTKMRAKGDTVRHPRWFVSTVQHYVTDDGKYVLTQAGATKVDAKQHLAGIRELLAQQAQAKAMPFCAGHTMGELLPEFDDGGCPF